jgi:hypothetical protein
MHARRYADVYILVAVLACVLFAQQKLNVGIGSDGALYFSYLRSAVFDHDLDIREEIAVLRQDPRPHDIVPIGPAIFWAPAYLAVAAGDRLGEAAGWWTRETGPSLGLHGAYVQAAIVTSFFVMAASLLALHLRNRREFGGSIALVTSILVLGATTLAWYVVYEPSMTHAVSFGVVAIALVLTERWMIDDRLSIPRAVFLGAWFSIVLLVRPEDGVFLLFPLCALVFGPAARTAPVPERARWAGAMVAGAMPLILLQVYVLRSIWARDAFALVGGDEGYLSLHSEWLNVLFSSRHGLLSWTPFVWVALIGTVGYFRRRPLWAVPALIAFAVLTWTNGSAHDWSGGWAFGGRRFTSALAGLAPGVATALAWFRGWRMAILVPAAAAVIAWNALLMNQYATGKLPHDEAVRFDVLVGQQINQQIKPPFFYPFAFPANVLFAWREGLPVDRYDLLGPEPLRREMYLPLNDWGARFLLDGWSNAGGDAFGSSHILAAPSATILVPLDVPSDRPFGIDVEARAAGEPRGAATRLEVAVNGRSFGDVPLEIGVAKPLRKTFIAPAGSKLWRRGYNRVMLSRPRDAAPTTAFVVYAIRAGASLATH